MFEQPPKRDAVSNEKKSPQLDPEVERHLEAIDFGRIRELFTEKIQGLGLDPEKNMKSFVGQKSKFRNISLLDRLRGGRASYRMSDKSIGIDPKLVQKAENADSESEQDRGDLLLGRICHEETHAVSFQELTIEKESWRKKKASKQIGYEQYKIELNFLSVSDENLFNALNEGVTDLIGQEVFTDYLQKKEKAYSRYQSAYYKERDLVLFLSIEIAHECGLDRKILWKVMQRGYFAGEDLVGEKMEKLFQNIFPNQFKKLVAEFKHSDSRKNLNEIEELWKKTIWTDADKKRVRRWVLSVYHAMPKEVSDPSASAEPSQRY